MTGKKAPCIDCAARQPGCHASCGKYMTHAGAEALRQAAIRQAREQERVADSFKKDAIIKSKRAAGMR